MPLPRFRLRSLLIAVAVVAGTLAVVARPYPRAVARMRPSTMILWSDGTAADAEGDGPYPIQFHIDGLAMRVDWSDGSTSWYSGRWLRWLHRPVRKPPSGR